MQIDGQTTETVAGFIFWAPKSLQIMTAAMKLRLLLLGMEKAMAPHSGTLAWKLPWMEEPSRL